VAERYPVNARVLGRVVNVTDYGAFVELEPGIEGLIHISEMTWSRRMKHPSKVVKPNDQVEAVVLEVHPKERRISLGLKQLEPNPWTTIDTRYSVGSVVEGRVRNMTDFGAFIEIEEGIDGLVHVSDLSWTKRIKHPSEVLKKGQTVQAVILAIDSGAHRLSLGVKQLQPDAWESFFQTHQVGDTLHGKVCRLASFGAFVELAEGVEGLCHFSEVPGYAGKRAAESPLAVGQEYDFKIVKMSEAEKKIGLSLRAAAVDEEKTRLVDYQRLAAAATTTIEEAMGLKEPEPK
jgi:small subunit ribosomal protein S1